MTLGVYRMGAARFSASGCRATGLQKLLGRRECGLAGSAAALPVIASLMSVNASETINEVDFCAKVCADAQEMLQRSLGLKVRIEDKRGRGRVII